MQSDSKLIIHNNVIGISHPDIEVVNALDDENEESFRYATLKDIAIIMYSMVGHGVNWELSNELSKRLEFHNPALISNVLSEIFKEYYEMSEEDAMERHEISPRLYDPMT